MTTFTWMVHQLETQMGEPSQTIVHWECGGELNGMSGRDYGTCILPSGEDVPPLSELTEALTLELCWGDGLDKDAREAVVQSQIDQQINTSLGLTWDTSLTHEDYQQRAFAKIDAVHADFMKRLTGGATVEERDTWVTKDAAATFVAAASDDDLLAAVALVASSDPTANPDLEALVFDVGEGAAELRALAGVILTKSRAYKRLIGIASGIRREAKAAVTAATAPEMDLDGVGEALSAIEETMMAGAQAVIAKWQSGYSHSDSSE